MAKLNSFEEMEVWKRARVVAKSIFEITKQGEFLHDFKLRDQINDSASSIMANIAEGFERDGNREFIQFLYFSKGSGGETRSHLYVAYDRGYISKEVQERLNLELVIIGNQLAGLIRYLKRSEFKGIKKKE